MYQGKNPKALLSQRLLLDALNALLQEKEFKDISVSELCSKSGVSRQTFYSLFETKENILLYQLDLINDTKPDHEDTSAMQLNDVCDRYSQYVSSNYKLLSILVENGLSEVLYTQFYQSMASCQQSFVGLNDDDREYAALFMSAGLCKLTQKYILEHAVPDKTELRRISYKIMSGSIYKKG
ncbi:MAG: TetR/AcrR family transcriptional regulator [Oscillospiraceae bacterium]|nr:TetR/AcrR family transcriptional regulator [Oscillospiraceae bacterium]